MAYPFSFAFLLLSIGSTTAATPLDSWAEYPRPNGAGAPISVVFGNGIFVAGGEDGSILTSTNGADWAQQNSGTTTDLVRIKCVNGRFFAIALDSSIITSEDGIDWDPISTNIGFSDITFANGFYYGVNPSGPHQPERQFLKSSNLVDWEPLSGPVMSYLTFANGSFVAGNAGVDLPTYANSTDFESWEPLPIPGSAISETTFQNGTWFAIRHFQMWENGHVGGHLPIWSYLLTYSYDSKNWSTAFDFPSKNAMFTPIKAAVGGEYYIFPTGSSVHYTTNIFNIGFVPQTHWTKVDLTIGASETAFSDSAFGNDTFVVITHGKIFKSNPVTGLAPLRITKHPQSASVNVGGTVTLSILAQGSDPISYQWRHQGTNIPAATANALTLTNVTFDTAGNYDVQITNPAGTITSDAAALTIHFADVNFYAGVTLRGNPGDTFKIEYQDQLNQSGQWNHAADVTLTTSQSIWIDYDSPTQTNRFYRATFQSP